MSLLLRKIVTSGSGSQSQAVFAVASASPRLQDGRTHLAGGQIPGAVQREARERPWRRCWPA